MSVLYDRIGHGYARLRRPDPRIATAIHRAIGGAKTLVNVGAGSGSYEPADRSVIAVELSDTMIAQRPPGAPPAVQASAMALPFRNNAFDAALAVLTAHHWQDRKRGLRELRRVAHERVVILTWDPAFTGSFWLSDYLPQVLEYDRPIFPAINEYREIFSSVEVLDVPIPHDCTDGFMCAYWRRPEAYLDPDVRSAISTFAQLGDISPALQKLEQDLASGEWRRRNLTILEQRDLDLGYRLIVARP